MWTGDQVEYFQKRTRPFSFEGPASEHESLAPFHMWPTCFDAPHFRGDEGDIWVKKGLKINVGGWINANIRHAIRQGFGGIPHPMLLIKLIASHDINTISQKVLQPKAPFNPKAIEWIMTLELRQEATRASSSGT